jgi:hypothetical protein
MTPTQTAACAVVILCTQACGTPSPTSPSLLPRLSTLLLEAEAAGGQGYRMERSSASGGLTVHLAPGERREWSFSVLDPSSEYLVTVRYSNDETGVSEMVRTTIDGVLVGSFRALDTGDDGAGWNAFVIARLGTAALSPGQHTLAVESSEGDGCIEIDVVTVLRE